MWFEVETKFRVYDAKLLMDKIRKIGEFVKKEKKADEYFATNLNGYPKKAFRIRYDGKKYVVNFKKWRKELYEKDIVVKEEYEFELKSEEPLRNFISLLSDLGFEKWINKKKNSVVYRYK